MQQWLRAAQVEVLVGPALMQQTLVIDTLGGFPTLFLAS